MADFVIELDLSRGEDADEPPHPARRSRRLLLLACLVCLIALSTLAGARALPPPRLVQLGAFSVAQSAGQIELLPDGALIIVERAAVAAYESDGARRWHVALPGAIEGSARVRLINERLLIGWSVFVDDGDSNMLAIHDFRSGGELWRSHGDAYQVKDVLIVRRDDAGIEVLDAADYTPLWQVTGDGAAESYADEVGSVMLTLAADGALIERDLRTGAVRRSARLEFPPATHLNIYIENDLLVVTPYNENVDEDQKQHFFDRWTWQPIPAKERKFAWIDDCGQVGCAYSPDSGLMSIVDKVTGAVLWRAKAGEYGARSGDDGLLIRFDGDRVRGLVDPRSGAIRVPLDGWQWVEGDYGLAELVVIRREESGTFVGLVAGDRLDIVGRMLPHGIDVCRTRARLLVCNLPDGRLGLWKIS